MEGSNGSAKGARNPKAMNGLDGVSGNKASINGHAVVPRRRPLPKRRGFVASSLSVFARLLAWYSILTILFRCPASLDACDGSSPHICKPYFQLKNTLAPHVEPYYDVHARPYVEAARPYYDAVDRTVLTPAWGYAAKYGAPRVAQAQAIGQAQWEKTVQPQVVKYQALVKSKYDEALAPHVDRLTTTIGPYYDIARTNALQTYHELLLPTYEFIEPYALQSYSAASAFTTGTAIPAAVWAWNKTYVFLDGTVWPQLRVIYVENVEPQLVKIGQRLGRYHGNATQKHIVEPAASIASKASSSFTKPAPTSVVSSVSSIVEENVQSASSEMKADASTASEAATTMEPAKPRSSAQPVPGPEEPEAGESDIRKTARETVAEDLKAWQEKYAKAADEGAAEIESRVEEIAKRVIRRQARTTGKSLLEDLQQSMVTELAALRQDIQAIVAECQNEDASTQAAEDKVLTAVRRAGKEVKERAQAVRTWREEYDAELHASVTKVAETHFKILDSIKDLALQKIGMKWAWMDGITYKDWAKYHQLKDRFDEWENDLEQLIVTHPALEQAQNEGQSIEDKAMELAQSAVKELARLKQVASWKLAANDETDEFDSDLMKAAAETAQKIKDMAKSAQADAQKAAGSVVDDMVGSASSASHVTSETVSEALPVDDVEAATSVVESIVSEARDGASFILETPAASTESLSNEASSSATEVFSEMPSDAEEVKSAFANEENFDPSSSVEGVPEPTDDPLAASAIILKETPVIAGNTTEATEVEGEAVPIHLPVDEVAGPQVVIAASFESTSAATPDPASSTTSVKSALFGAAAQEVPSRVPILDDDSLDDAASMISSMQSDIPRTISSAAQSAYSVAMSRAAEQYSQAVSLVSAQIKGTPKPAHEQLLSSVTSAYSQAMASASSRLDDALSAAENLYGSASAKIAPTTTPAPLVDWARVEAIAAERLNHGRSWAEEQYESAKVAVGLATPTPASPVEKVLENARYNYYAGLGMAHARYSEFMAAASSAFSSLTATPTPTDLVGTASSVASVASKSAASAASAASENASSIAAAAGSHASSAASAASDGASSVVSAASSHVSSAASVVGENVSSAAAAGYENVASAAGAAGDFLVEKWDDVLNQVSMQVYGAPTPTPWYESVLHAAGEYAAAATEAAGEGASSVTSAAGTYATAASEEAAKQYTAVSSLVSELLVGKEPSFTESVYSRLSAAYSSGASSAASIANAAAATAASVGSEATEAVKDTAERIRDEL